MWLEIIFVSSKGLLCIIFVPVNLFAVQFGSGCIRNVLEDFSNSRRKKKKIFREDINYFFLEVKKSKLLYF